MMKIPLIIETSPGDLGDIGSAVIRTTEDGRIIHLRDVARICAVTYASPIIPAHKRSPGRLGNDRA
jgi:hypothetical protein